MSRASRLILPALLLVALLALWELAARSEALSDLLGIEPFLVPAPSDVAESLWQDRALLAENAWVTFREVLGGFAVALALGVGFAVVLHLSEILRRAFYPLVVASQTIPIIVVAPIFVVWFGFGIGPKIAVIALICFFPITVNTLDGLGTVDPEKRKLMRTLGAGRLQTLARLELPSALPHMLSGAKIAIAVAVIGAVFGEWAGSDAGLSHQMLLDNAQLEIPRLFAAMTVLSVMAIALFGLVALVERRFAWWGDRTRTRAFIA
ncbi:MAG TPA: ABC transporter permease [Solirubrobacterales bacterium]|nr:ABC transporter permease [Solirubrobacterales bacterium]